MRKAHPRPSGKLRLVKGGAILTSGDPDLREEPPTWREIRRTSPRSPQSAGGDSPAFRNIQADGSVLVLWGQEFLGETRHCRGDSGACRLTEACAHTVPTETVGEVDSLPGGHPRL